MGKQGQPELLTKFLRLFLAACFASLSVGCDEDPCEHGCHLSRVPLNKELWSTVSKGHALLINVSRYDDRQWEPLPYGLPEVSSLRNALAPHFSRVEVLSDPTIYQLISAVEHELGDLGEQNARLFVVYTGHGFAHWDPSNKNYIEHITASDTPAYSANPESAVQMSLGMDVYARLAERSKATQILTLIDACASGMVFDSLTKLQPPDLGNPSTGTPDFRRARVYVASASRAENVPVDSPILSLFGEALEGRATPYFMHFIPGQPFHNESDITTYIRERLDNPKGTEGNFRWIEIDRGPVQVSGYGDFLFKAQPLPYGCSPEGCLGDYYIPNQTGVAPDTPSWCTSSSTASSKTLVPC